MGVKDKLRRKSKELKEKLKKLDRVEKHEKEGYYVVRAGKHIQKAFSYDEARQIAKELARKGYDVHIDYRERKIKYNIKRSKLIGEHAKKFANEAKKAAKEIQKIEKSIETGTSGNKKGKHKKTRLGSSSSVFEQDIFFGSIGSHSTKKKRSSLPKLI